MSRASQSTVGLDRARWALAKIWFTGAGVLFLFLIAQSFGTVYQGRVSEAWSWALPAVMPTLSLIAAVLKSTAFDARGGAQLKVRREFYLVTIWLSAVYLALVLATILAGPLVTSLHSDEHFSTLDLMKTSNLWLAPIQSLVVACIGTLFFQKSVTAK